MAATKFSFFFISTSYRGDFPRIIEIALYFFFDLVHTASEKYFAFKSNLMYFEHLSQLPLYFLPHPTCVCNGCRKLYRDKKNRLLREPNLAFHYLICRYKVTGYAVYL